MKPLNSINKIEKIVRKNGGIYNDRKEWVPLNGIQGIIRLRNGLKGCSIIQNVAYQSVNAVYLRNDGNLYISAYSIGGTFTGELNSENINKYNKSMIYDGSKIVEYIKI